MRSSLPILMLWGVGLLPAQLVLAETGVVTWLHPEASGQLRVESAVPGVTVQVLRGDTAEAVTDLASLKAAGWQPAADGCWETPARDGGGKLLLRITGLPAGTQTVSLRFFSQPRVPGNEWWYLTETGVEGDPQARGAVDHTKGTIVRGTGGYDPASLYEAPLGTVGSGAQPVTAVACWVRRYQWSQVARISSLRIETDPALLAQHTQDPGPANDALRAELLESGPAGAEGQRSYGVRVVSGSLKVRPQRLDSLREQTLDTAVRLLAARGEYESRQIIVYSPGQDLTGVRLSPSALRGPDGTEIATTDILAAPVGYCPYRLPHDLANHGYWPEPILTFLDVFAVSRYDLQAVWYRVHVPRDARPGRYTGVLTLTPDNAPAWEVPVELTVWDCTLPPWPRLRVVVGCNRSDDFEMGYGLNPSTLYGFDETWREAMAGWAARGVTAVNLGYINHGGIDATTKLPTLEQVETWCRDIGARYEAARGAGLADRCYVYLFDEAGNEWRPALRLVSAELARRFPRILQLTTAQDASFGIESDTPHIGAWCPLTIHYSLEAAAAARRRGKEVWWYTCNAPQKPFANLLMTSPALDLRLLLGFMALAFKTDGYLYYATAGGYYANMPAITAGPYTSWAIHDNAHDHLYQKGPDGPLPSLRLEALRDGLEDYEYLWAARDRRRQLQERRLSSPATQAEDAWVAAVCAPGNDLVRSLTDYTQSPADLDAARRRLAAYITAADQALKP